MASEMLMALIVNNSKVYLNMHMAWVSTTQEGDDGCTQERCSNKDITKSIPFRWLAAKVFKMCTFFWSM